jgi:hypothetical protein
LLTLGLTHSSRVVEENDPVGGFRFRLYAADGSDLGTRTFAEPNWIPGDTVALADRLYRCATSSTSTRTAVTCAGC